LKTLVLKEKWKIFHFGKLSTKNISKVSRFGELSRSFKTTNCTNYHESFNCENSGSRAAVSGFRFQVSSTSEAAEPITNLFLTKTLKTLFMR